MLIKFTSVDQIETHTNARCSTDCHKFSYEILNTFANAKSMQIDWL